MAMIARRGDSAYNPQKWFSRVSGVSAVRLAPVARSKNPTHTTSPPFTAPQRQALALDEVMTESGFPLLRLPNYSSQLVLYQMLLFGA